MAEGCAVVVMVVAAHLPHVSVVEQGLEEVEVLGMVFGELGTGIYLIFEALFLPGVFPFLAFTQSGGFIAEDREQGNAFVFDELVDQGLNFEGGIAGIKFGYGHELGVLLG